MISISENCISCGVCVDICPVSALRLTKTGVWIDKSICVGCGICVHKCPVKVIQLMKESDNCALIKDIRFQVTAGCNFNCPWCFSDAKKPLDRELSLREAIDMVDQLILCGLKTMTLTGGEPLLRKEFSIGLLKYLNKKKVYAKLFTNGSLLDEKTISDLSGFVNEVQISDYGMVAPDKLRMMLRGLKRHKIRTALRITLTSKNYNSVKRLIKFAEENAVDILRVRPFIAKGRGLKHRDYLMGYAAYKESIGYLSSVRRNKNYFIQLLTPSFPFLYDKQIKLKMFSNPGFIGYTLCKCIEYTGAILPDGKVRACGYFPHDLGNIKKQSFKKIWSEDGIKKVLIADNLDKGCMECEYISICGGGCRANAYINTGNLRAPDPNCPRLKENIAKPILYKRTEKTDYAFI